MLPAHKKSENWEFLLGLWEVISNQCKYFLSYFMLDDILKHEFCLVFDAQILKTILNIIYYVGFCVYLSIPLWKSNLFEKFRLSGIYDRAQYETCLISFPFLRKFSRTKIQYWGLVLGTYQFCGNLDSQFSFTSICFQTIKQWIWRKFYSCFFFLYNFFKA